MRPQGEMSLCHLIRLENCVEEDDFMKKRVLSFLTALALCLGFLPGTAFAAETTVGLDFSSQESDSAGDGYSWAAETKTLTLTNFSQTLSDSSGNEICGTSRKT